MESFLLENLKQFLKNERSVKFAYLFGSHARDDAGLLSDVDIAVYLDNRFDFFKCRLSILEKLARALKTDSCDLVILNNAPIDLQFEIIHEGKILKEDKEKRVLFESRAVGDFLDQEQLRQIHLSSLKKRFRQETNFGQ